MRYRFQSVLVLLLIVAVPAVLWGQIVCSLGMGGSGYNPYLDQGATPYALEFANRVNQAFTSICSPNCPSVLLVRNVSVPNAMMVANGPAMKIVYSPQFLTGVNNQFGEDAIVGIIAHEYGHAIDAVTPATWMNGSWGRELRADAWAGCALARDGLSPNALQSALSALFAYPSYDHPGANLRLPAIQAGYEQCGGKSDDIHVSGTTPATGSRRRNRPDSAEDTVPAGPALFSFAKLNYGDGESAVISRFGDPTKRVEHTDGMELQFFDDALTVYLDRTGRVNEISINALNDDTIAIEPRAGRFIGQTKAALMSRFGVRSIGDVDIGDYACRLTNSTGHTGVLHFFFNDDSGKSNWVTVDWLRPNARLANPIATCR